MVLLSGARESHEESELGHEQIAPFFLHDDPWTLLRLYHVYRLALAGVLLLSVVTDHNAIKLGTYDAHLFSWLTVVYLVIAIISNLTSYFEWPDLPIQGVLYVLFDITILL